MSSLIEQIFKTKTANKEGCYELYIYKEKVTGKNQFYISEKGLNKFQDDYFTLKWYYINNKVLFGEYDHEVLFKKYMKI